MVRSTGRLCLRSTLLRCAWLMMLCSLAAVPALAQDKPSLKEILGRAQSESERKAVEDLIGKLQGKPPQAKQASPDASAPPVAAGEAKPDQAPAGGEPVDKGTAESRVPSVEDQQSSASAITPPDEQPAATAAKSSSEVPASEAQAAEEPPKVATRPEADAAELAVEKAEREQLPSVDLEVLFELNSAKLTPQAVETLTTLGRALVDDRLATTAFLIGGHTDAKGRAAYNLRLSERRAEAVRQFLIASFAIDASRLTAKGFGSRHLKNPQRPRAAENRRVQVINMSQREAR